MGWMPAATTFSYGLRSKCADLPELLRKSTFQSWYAFSPLAFSRKVWYSRCQKKEKPEVKGNLLVWLVNMSKPPDSDMPEGSSISGIKVNGYLQKISCCFFLHSGKIT